MKINPAGIDLIKKFEGCRLETYNDAIGIPSIGYGHTGCYVRPGLCITQEKAEELLRLDLSTFEEGVTKLLKRPINENQFSALVCFAFNCGLENLKKSTLLHYVNAMGDASNEFLKWNRAGGRILLGLTERRKAERELYLTPC